VIGTFASIWKGNLAAIREMRCLSAMGGGLHIVIAWNASPTSITLSADLMAFLGAQSSRSSCLTSVVSVMSNTKERNGSAHSCTMSLMILTRSAWFGTPFGIPFSLRGSSCNFHEIQIWYENSPLLPPGSWGASSTKDNTLTHARPQHMFMTYD
jgi:hypothetical protein